MQDGQWSASRVVATALWTWTACFGVLVWVALLLGREGLLHAFGFTACASSAVAATASIRCYTLKLCALLRAQTPHDDGGGRVRTLH